VDIVGLLKFIETYCFDEQLYMVLPISNGGQEEIIWHRDEKNRPWSVRSRHEGASAWRYTAEKLPRALERRSVSMEAFEKELMSTVLLHVTHANLMIRDAQALLGQDAVESAMESFDAFGVELNNTVRQVLNLSAGEPPTHTERAAHGHLRLLVRNDQTAH